MKIQVALAAAKRDPRKYGWYKLTKAKAHFDNVNRSHDLTLTKDETFGVKESRGNFFLVDPSDLTLQFKLTPEMWAKLRTSCKPWTGKVGRYKVLEGDKNLGKEPKVQKGKKAPILDDRSIHRTKLPDEKKVEESIATVLQRVKAAKTVAAKAKAVVTGIAKLEELAALAQPKAIATQLRTALRGLRKEQKTPTQVTPVFRTRKPTAKKPAAKTNSKAKSEREFNRNRRSITTLAKTGQVDLGQDAMSHELATALSDLLGSEVSWLSGGGGGDSLFFITCTKMQQKQLTSLLKTIKPNPADKKKTPVKKTPAVDPKTLRDAIQGEALTDATLPDGLAVKSTYSKSFYGLIFATGRRTGNTHSVVCGFGDFNGKYSALMMPLKSGSKKTQYFARPEIQLERDYTKATGQVSYSEMLQLRKQLKAAMATIVDSKAGDQNKDNDAAAKLDFKDAVKVQIKWSNSYPTWVELLEVDHIKQKVAIQGSRSKRRWIPFRQVLDTKGPEKEVKSSDGIPTIEVQKLESSFAKASMRARALASNHGYKAVNHKQGKAARGKGPVSFKFDIAFNGKVIFRCEDTGRGAALKWIAVRSPAAPHIRFFENLGHMFEHEPVENVLKSLL